MDNREFAKLLLCEATELLEGAQAEAYKARKAKENINQGKDKYIRRLISPRGNVSLGHTMRTSVGYDTATKDPKYKNDLNIPLNTFVYNNYDKQRGIDLKIMNKADKMAKKAIGVTDDEYKKAYNNDKSLENIRKRELAADAARRHIRRHEKKTQNESIAVLLTEAALLLNETIVIPDDLPKKLFINFFNNVYNVSFDNLAKNDKDYDKNEVKKILNKFVASSKKISEKIESRFCSDCNKLNDDKSYTGIDKDIKKYSDIPNLKLTDMYIRKGYKDEPKYILCLYGHFPIDPEHGFSLLFNGTSVIVNNFTLNNKKHSYIIRCNGYTQE